MRDDYEDRDFDDDEEEFDDDDIEDEDEEDEDEGEDEQPRRARGRSRRGRPRPQPRGRGRRGRRRQVYCPEGKCFDYKDVDTLRRYVTDAGKIKPRRQTGNCSRCQRELAREIKRARHLALLPFAAVSE